LPAAGSRLAHLVLSAVLRGLERFTGLQLVREVGDFVRAIEALTDALRARVSAADALLRAEGTALVLVTAPEPRLVDENARLAHALAGLGLPIGGIIVNRMLPRALFAPGAPPPPDGLPPALVARLRRAHAELATLAARQEAVLQPLVDGAGAPVQAEHGLDVPVDASLGLERRLHGAPERLCEARTREQGRGERPERFPTEAAQSPDDHPLSRTRSARIRCTRSGRVGGT